MQKKLIIFDLDGVLVDSKDMHFNALNEALKELNTNITISYTDHVNILDGLPTQKKLIILNEKYGLKKELFDSISKLKQLKTLSYIHLNFKEDKRIIEILKKLKQENVLLCVASNAKKDTVNLILEKKGFSQYIDFYLSNEDVYNPKPSSEIYLRCMLKAEADPVNTLIIEDSQIGRKAANNSGCNVLGVLNSNDLTLDKILNKLNFMNSNLHKWQFKNLNVLIPMAGEGSRFAQAGYTFPKPLIEIHNKPMIQIVVDNLNVDAKFIFIVKKDHYEKYNLRYVLSLIAPNCEIVTVDKTTEGAACTALLAEKYINNDNPLLIANSDQFIDWKSDEFFYEMQSRSYDGSILLFNSTHPKWSFAKLDENNFVTEVAEKKPISNNATCGIYFYKSGSFFVKYAKQMIDKNIRVNNEFYICPVFNEMILDKKIIKGYFISKMHGLGTPEDLNLFLKNNE